MSRLQDVLLPLQQLQEIHRHSVHHKRCISRWGTSKSHQGTLPALTYPFQSVTITKGQPLVNTFLDTVQDSGNSLQRKFCSKCGTPLYNVGGDFGKTLAVFYSALDDYHLDTEVTPKPKVEYYSKDRLSWVGPVGGAEQPRTKPGRD